MTYREAVAHGEKVLELSHIADAKTDAWLLLEMGCKIDRKFYYMHMEDDLSDDLLKEYELAVKKRAEHIPLQYIVGETEFMGLKFKVNSNVLIPRQDTECLVELAVEDIRNVKTQNRCEFNNAADQKNEQKVKVLDLCTGSGCIGISVKKLCQNTKVTLADISEGALAVAKKNAENLNANVTLIRGNLFENIEGRFDYILSNPPYIPSQVIQGLMPEVKDHEPRMALDGEPDLSLIHI